MMDILVHIDWTLFFLSVIEAITLALFVGLTVTSITERLGTGYVIISAFVVLVIIALMAMTVPYIYNYEASEIHYLEVR